MAKKPVHIPSVEPVATVRIQAYWGNLERDYVKCSQRDAISQLQKLVDSRAQLDPTPARVSFLVSVRRYSVKHDSYSDWKPLARYNHLGLEIAL